MPSCIGRRPATLKTRPVTEAKFQSIIRSEIRRPGVGVIAPCSETVLLVLDNIGTPPRVGAFFVVVAVVVHDAAKSPTSPLHR